MGEKGRIRRRLLVLSSLVPWLVSAPAQASHGGDFGPFDVVGAGIFFGYAFGESRGVEWGVEAFATRYFNQAGGCSEGHRGFGPLLRLTGVKSPGFAFTAAGHIGGELSPNTVALDLELGGTLLKHGEGSRGSIHTGVALESIVFNAYARQQWLLERYSVGAGARFLPTFGFGDSCAVTVGRAFRDSTGDARSRKTLAAACFDERCPDAARWADRAREECSSILAFLQLALELLDEDAPLPLVARALRCAEQELSHTWAAASLAARFGRAPVAPCSPVPRFRQRLPSRQQRERLAREAWVDGFLNEGLAALVAAEEARDAKDAHEARVSAKIAREEAEHAALAFDVLRWLSQSGTPTPTSQQAEIAPFASSPLGARRLRELAHSHTTTAHKHLAERAGVGATP